MKSPYEILGVNQNATLAKIKSAYRKLAAKHHPDHDGDRETFEAIQLAFDILSDPDRRERFDRTGQTDDIELEIQANVERTIAGCFEAAFDQERKGPFEFMRDHVARLRSLAMDGKNASQKQIKKIEKRAARIRAKDESAAEAAEEFRKRLLSTMESHKATIQEADIALKAFKRVMEKIDHLECPLEHPEGYRRYDNRTTMMPTIVRNSIF